MGKVGCGAVSVQNAMLFALCALQLFQDVLIVFLFQTVLVFCLLRGQKFKEFVHLLILCRLLEIVIELEGAFLHLHGYAEDVRIGKVRPKFHIDQIVADLQVGDFLDLRSRKSPT